MMLSMDDEAVIPRCPTTRRRLIEIEEILSVKVVLALARCSSNKSLTMNPRSTAVCLQYRVVTVHGTDDSWMLRHAIIKFEWFLIPHVGYASYASLKDVIIGYGPIRSGQSVITDNTSDIIKSMSKVTMCLQETVPDIYSAGTKVHLRCIADEIYPAVKEGMLVIHSMINTVGSDMSSIRSNVK